jgi:membrane associated rhomboid family serine protease
MSRSTELLRSLPICTLGILGLCIGLHILLLALDWDLKQFTMCPRLVLYLHEWYRVVTSALFHANLMHIGMNMMSTFGISTLLEKRLGTLSFGISTLWAILLTSFIYLGVSYALFLFLGETKWMYQHSVGFSGILFHMTVLECNLSTTRSRSLFGFVDMPTYLYPWALLILLQMFMPNLSFLGHLSGIVTGTLQSYGSLDVLFLSEAYLREMESWHTLQWLVRRPNFIATPSGSSRLFPQEHSLGRSICNGVGVVVKFVRDLLETALVCLFGRGRSLNSNIQLSGTPTTWPSGGRTVGGGSAVEAVEEDDQDWNGLPSLSSMAAQERVPLSRIV